jgi:CheY-like chemotaxis protein
MSPPPQRGKNILIVEDDAATRDALTMVLTDEGYSVRAAANGREAIDLLRGGAAPDLIILDLMMPVMDGWQFRSEQQRHPDLTRIPVVVLSADGTVRDKAASLGAVGCLQKPIEVDDLLHEIERCC